jgi:hypothetical protein
VAVAKVVEVSVGFVLSTTVVAAGVIFAAGVTGDREQAERRAAARRNIGKKGELARQMS